ncbi:MAG TPA: signal peptidase I [Candidatus Paceibacterota bacterium]|jgi:signal peptidase I
MEPNTKHEPEENRTPSTTPAPSHALPEKKENFFGDVVRFALIAFIIVVPIRIFIAQPFIVQGASMLPTFDSGQYLIVDQLSYHFTPPIRGEVVIFKHPHMPSTFLIKRVVGLPGETIELRGQTVTIKSAAEPNGFVLEEPYIREQTVVYEPQTITLGLGEYFVLGDNRNASSDSRAWGALDQTFIVGKAFLRLLPISETSVHPGDYSDQ